MKKNDENRFKKRWALLFGIAAVLGYAYIIVRYVDLLLRDRDKYIEVVEENEVATVERRGRRGNIYDCRGRLVSATLPEYIVYIDLTVPYLHTGIGKDSFPIWVDRLSYELSARFGEESPDQLKQRLMTSYKRCDLTKHDNGVRLLKRKLSYDEYKEVCKMTLLNRAPSRGGRVVVERQNRENLFGGMARRVVGAVYGIDDTTHTTLGRFGIEQSFDKELSGSKGLYLRQRLGGSPMLKPITPAEDGCDVVMTLDMDIQDICECALREKLIESQAESACMILMEVETGEIKSIVNFVQPEPGNVLQGTNMALAMNNQPGSTFKTVCMMSVLENEDCDSSTLVLVNGGIGRFGGKVLHDSHLYKEKYLSLSAVMARSSNVGMAQLVEDVYSNTRAGWRKFSDDLAEIGFDHHIDIEIKGAADPIIHRYGEYKEWSGTTMTAMSRGYGVQTTPLYTLNFYNAIANDGYYVKPHLVKALRRGGEFVKEFGTERRRNRMCSSNTLQQIKGMLEGVVSRSDGTAYRFVNSKLFTVAGKTGTARYKMVDDAWRYQISFVGYFPADKPKYSAIVVFMCPRFAYTGMYCGGVFKQVAEAVWSMDQAIR